MLHCNIVEAVLSVSWLIERRRALGALGTLALAGPGPWVRAGAPAPQAITVAVGGGAVHPLRHLPLDIAQQLDYFRQEGLDATLQDHASDALALHALARGQADVAAVGYEHAVQAAAAPGAGLRALVLQTRAPQLALAVSLRALPRYRDPGDLRRSRIGISAWGALDHAMACMVLAQAGLAPEEVQFIAVGDGPRAQAALRAGRVHALCQPDAVLARLERQGEVRIVADARGLDASQAVFGGPMPGTCLVASTAFVQARAGRAQALVNAVVHALKWLRTAEPADVVRLVPPAGLLAERSLYFAALARVREVISPDGMMPEAGPATALRALAVLQPTLAVRKGELARTYTQDFVRQARQKYGV